MYQYELRLNGVPYISSAFEFKTKEEAIKEAKEKNKCNCDIAINSCICVCYIVGQDV